MSKEEISVVLIVIVIGTTIGIIAMFLKIQMLML
jgi:hypothetical protein